MGRVASTIGLAFGLFGAVIASQGPEFVQQYRQRLGGAVDELGRVVRQLDADADRTGQTRNGALDRLRDEGTDFARLRADAMRSDAERLDRLQRQRQALDGAGPFGRLLVFVRDVDPPVARAAYDDFVPAVPTTETGLLAAAIGFAGGWVVLALIAGVLRTLFGRATVRRSRVPHGHTA